MVPSNEFLDTGQDLRAMKGMSVKLMCLTMADVDNSWTLAGF